VREVLAVRLFTLFTLTCLVSGSIMYYNSNNSDLSLDSQQRDNLDTAFLAAEEEDASTNTPEQSTEKQPKNTPTDLIFLGTGGISSLILASLFSEVFRITVLISLVTPLISRSKNSHDLLTRGRLLGYLEANAGIHFSALRDALGLANGVTAYHLQVLERNGKIISWKDGKLRRYAISQISQSKLEKIRNPIMGTRLAILEVLSSSGKIGISSSEISKKLSISRQLMSYHISELKNSKYIDSALERKRPKWKLTDLGIEVLNSSNSLQDFQ